MSPIIDAQAGAGADGAGTADLFDPQNAVGVVRYKGAIHWCLSAHDNWVLDWNAWWHAFAAAGHRLPALDGALAQRSGIAVVDEDTAQAFLNAKEVRRLETGFLRRVLLAHFPAAQSWWDVRFLFPLAFVDVDARRLAAFYHDGPRLEQYVPEGWVGEFADFAATYPETVFPAADKFWIVDGRDLLEELNERGRSLVHGHGEREV